MTTIETLRGLLERATKDPVVSRHSEYFCVRWTPDDEALRRALPALLAVAEAAEKVHTQEGLNHATCSDPEVCEFAALRTALAALREVTP